MRNIVCCKFALFVSLVGCFYEPTIASATTWYVRTDGGDATQCTGQVDAPYPGSGTGQACAVNHLFWLLKPNGLGGLSGAAVLQGGDTVIVGPGEYQMGIGAPNTTSCNAAWAYSCILPPLPSGPDAAHPTKIYGKGWDTKATPPPQLWGYGRATDILTLTGSNNIELRYLEITDHSGCVDNSPDPAKRCDRGSPYNKPFADNGIKAVGSRNVLLKDLDIHGLKRGMVAGRLTDWTLDGVILRANSSVGWDGDVGHGLLGSGTESSNSGNIVVRNSKIEYSGCGETYPGKLVYGCFSQSQGGYGDGIGMYFTEGYWLFEDTEFNHNVSDGLDLLYHLGTNGNVVLKRVRSEGNAGNAIKFASSGVIENSVFIGNCDYFNNNSIAEQGGNASYINTSGFDSCRAGGTPLMLAGWRPNQSVIMTNSLITGTTTVLIEAKSGASVSKIVEVTGTASNITLDNQYVTNAALDKIWLRPPGGADPNWMTFVAVISGVHKRITGTWTSVGNGIWELSGYRAQTGNVDNFSTVYLGFTCNGTEKYVARNNILLGMEGWHKKVTGVPGVKSDHFYLDGYDGNGNGPCGTGPTKIVMDNRDSIIFNTKFNQCPNSNNVLCQDPQLTAIPPLFGAADIYTYGEKWNVMPRELSPAVGVRSSLPGSTVLGDIVVPTNDYLGFGRPSDSITWGPLEFNKIPFAVLINDPVSPTNRSTQTISGSLTGSAAGASVTVRVGSAEPVAVPLAGASWSLDLTGLVPGKNQILVTAADASGNSVMATTSIVVDADPPSLLIVNPVQDFRTDQNSLLVEGKISDATTVKVSISVDGITYNPIVTNGTFKQNITFAVKNALHQLIIKAADSAGNQATIQRNVLYAEIPDGDIDGNGIVEFNDAIQALRIASGLLESDLSSLIRGNVAPIINGKPAPSGKISIQDVLVILRKYLGLISF